MENEKKEFQGTENENTLTPEERVREDISAKIADAAAEVQEEIDAASGIETEQETYVEEQAVETAEEAYEAGEDFVADDAVMDESWSDEAWEDAGLEETRPEPVKVTMNRNSLIISLIGSAILGALILLFCLQIPKWVEAMPEGSKVASVGDVELTDIDVNYYIYAQAANYMNKNNISMDTMADFDWDQEVDGVKLSDTIKEKAVDDAVSEAILIVKGAENGVTLDENEKQQISSQLAGISSSYGEDGFTLRARTMGIPSIKQYSKMYEKIMTVQKVQDDMAANPDNYYPEDKSVLNDYVQSDKASAKHILISTQATGDETVDVEEKRALAQSILDRINAGEDFDALRDEFDEDPGQTTDGYTFISGEMMPEFEEAAFALKIDEVSGIVETSYGFHIIKRIPGSFELENYWKNDDSVKIKVNERKIAKLSVKDVMVDVMSAMEEVEAEAAAASAAASAK